MAELIFEIGSEEIPARFIKPALTSIENIFKKEMGNLNIEFSNLKTFGTPRRLGLVVDGLIEVQPDRVEEVLGPKVAICFDADNKPTKVAIGFAKGQGVEVESLERVEGAKGECVKATKTVKGSKTGEVLANVLKHIISNVQFQKSMRWGLHSESFARPVHWIVALFAGEIVKLEFANIKSGNTSYGHRFMNPEPIEITSSDKFFADLKAANVIAFLEERAVIVRKEAKKLAEQAGGVLMPDDALAGEIANLVEYPFGEIGSFEEDFLKVPKEILIDSMAKHQKYFAILDKNGNLLPKFVVFINTKVKDTSVVVQGNERVLRARLSDAKFFFDEDRKKTLAEFASTLSKVTFEEKLGTIAEKIDRIKEQIKYMASFIDGNILDDSLKAASICKADLQTNVVSEFASLQGIMGGIYAKLEGQSDTISEAIEQHYWPRFAEDKLPKSDVSSILSLADKMDTVVGCFGVGLIPSGTADPYALRRQALGILRILISKGYRIALTDWIEFSISALRGKLTRDVAEVYKDVLSFFMGRYKNFRTSEYKQDTIDAALAAKFLIISDVEDRIIALSSFREQGGFAELAATFKRVMNILKEKPDAVVSPDLFVEKAENDLWSQYQRTRDMVGILIKSSDYLAALQAMMELKAPVDRFFDDVMVMDKNENIKNNRLSVLWHLAQMFSQVADFRKLKTQE